LHVVAPKLTLGFALQVPLYRHQKSRLVMFVEVALSSLFQVCPPAAEMARVAEAVRQVAQRITRSPAAIEPGGVTAVGSAVFVPSSVVGLMA
jgi:hypothetical protein